MDLSGGHQSCFPWAEYQPALEIPSENIAKPADHVCLCGAPIPLDRTTCGQH